MPSKGCAPAAPQQRWLSAGCALLHDLLQQHLLQRQRLLVQVHCQQVVLLIRQAAWDTGATLPAEQSTFDNTHCQPRSPSALPRGCNRTKSLCSDWRSERGKTTLVDNACLWQTRWGLGFGRRASQSSHVTGCSLSGKQGAPTRQRAAQAAGLVARQGLPQGAQRSAALCAWTASC